VTSEDGKILDQEAKYSKMVSKGVLLSSSFLAADKNIDLMPLDNTFIMATQFEWQ
jgi:hypothetical protein